MPGQQIFHRLRKTLVAEPLEKADGISADALRVAEPGAPVLDPDAVHLLGGVVVADPLYLIAQGYQQIRKVCVPNSGHLGICKADPFLGMDHGHLLLVKNKKGAGGHICLRCVLRPLALSLCYCSMSSVLVSASVLASLASGVLLAAPLSPGASLVVFSTQSRRF